MKNFKFFLCFIVPVLFVFACGSSDSETEPCTNISLTGTLSEGTITAGLVRAKAPAADYTVVALDNASNETYSGTTDANGDFSIEIPADTSVMLSIVHNGSYAGPTVFDGEGTSVNTVITPTEETTALGTIVVDADNGFARTETAPAIVDAAITAQAVDGVPVGAGDSGKEELAGITNRDDSDVDMDGIPNLFDADEDNDGIRNGIAAMSSAATVVSNYVETVYVSSNIWALHGEALPEGSEPADVAPDLIDMRLHVVPIEGQEAMIEGVQCIGIPDSISAIATIYWADSVGDPANYPDADSLWSDADYNLFQTTTLDQEEWIVSLTPHAIMNIGDTFTIRVTYTDATTEDFYVSVSYILTDWSRITTYNDVALTADEGTRTDPATYADMLSIEFSKPLDEDGNILDGLTYSVRYGESTLDGDTWSVPSTVTETSVTDTGDTLSFDIPVSDIANYYVTPVAESADGQRNGEQTWFTLF